MSIDYHKIGDIIEIVIKDSSERKIETHRASLKDKKKCVSILSYLRNKYNFAPEITPEENIDSGNINWWD